MTGPSSLLKWKPMPMGSSGSRMSANTMAATYVIAEKAAEMIRAG